MPEADAKFVSACSAFGIVPDIFPHPMPGPTGEALRTLACRIGEPDALDVLSIVSGTHGIEGYAGAGLQTGLLHGLLASPLPATLAIVFAHVINPWGCAWDRRENEDNVDVFRNLLYCDPPYAENAEYELLADAICPPVWHGPIRDDADRRLGEYDARLGAEAAYAVARRGQHTHPKGMTFHGRGPSWSKRTVDAIVGRHFLRARRILNLDIHTGYGSYGSGQVVSFASKGTETSSRLERWFGSDLLWLGGEADIPSHPRSPFDAACAAVSARVVSCALEFGTEAVQDIFTLLREASWIYNYGQPTSRHGQAVRRIYRSILYPDRNDWKQLVWNRGEQVIRQSIAAFSDPTW